MFVTAFHGLIEELENSESIERLNNTNETLRREISELKQDKGILEGVNKHIRNKLNILKEIKKNDNT